MTEINRQWCVADAPGSDGMALSRAQFAYCETEIPALQKGEVLIRNVYFSCDPMNHAWVKRGWVIVSARSRLAAPCGAG